jgi:hypothetical protein
VNGKNNVQCTKTCFHLPIYDIDGVGSWICIHKLHQFLVNSCHLRSGWKTQYVYHQPIFHRPKSYSKNTFIKIIKVSQNLRLGDNKLRLQAPIFGGTPVLANLNFNEVHYSSCWLTWLYSDGFNKLKLLISSYIWGSTFLYWCSHLLSIMIPLNHVFVHGYYG